MDVSRLILGVHPPHKFLSLSMGGNVEVAMKILFLTGIAVVCFTSLARADANDDRKQRQRDADKAYENRQQQQRDDKKAYERRQQQKKDDQRAYEKRQQQQSDDQRAYENRPQLGGATKEGLKCEDGKKSSPGASDHRSTTAKQSSIHADRHPDYDCMDAENEKTLDKESY